MNLIEKKTGSETKALLSTLWIFVLLNMVFRDIHEFGKPEFLAEALSRPTIPEELFLVAGILLEIPLAMIVLSRLLNYTVNRRINIIAAVFWAGDLLIFANQMGDLDDIFFFAVQIVGLAFIVWTAWKWRSPELNSNKSII